MRLTRAGVALIIFLLVACPLAALVSYAALTGTPIGPFRFGGGTAATATTQRVQVGQTATFAAVTPPANPRTGDATQTPNTSGTRTAPTATTNLGVVPITPSPAAAGTGTTTAGAPRSPTVAAVQPSATVGGQRPSPTGVGTGPAGPAGPAVAVAYDAYAPYFPVRIAATQGYAGRRGVALRQLPFGLNGQNNYTEEQRRQALRDGTFDVLLTTLDAVALFGDDQTGKVVAIVDESAGADKIVARAPIARLNDLRGRRIAFSGGSVAEFFLYANLSLAGLKATDVSPVPVGSVDEAVALFVNNQVDAVVGWEPVIGDAIQQPGAKVLIGTDNHRAILDVVVVSSKALAEKPDAIQAFLDAWFEAVKLTTDDPAAAGAAVARSGDADWTGIAAPEDFTEQLGLVAQATLGQNQLALRDPATLGARIRESRRIWRDGGKAAPDFDPARLVDGRFVQGSAARGGLDSSRPPLNSSFVLTSRIALPQLTPEQIGGTQAVAELPLKQIDFRPNSAILTDQGRRDLLEQVVPVLTTTPGLYLRIDGSAAQPRGDSDEDNRLFALDRANAVATFLAGQGIDPNRFIIGTVRPQFPGSLNEQQLAQDRRVIFTLVQPGGR